MAWYNPFSWGKQEADPTKSQLEHGDQLWQQVQQGLAGVQGRAAPQAGRTVVGPVATGTASQVDPTQQGQFRQMQMDAAQRQARIASGLDKGAGELATQRMVARGLAAQTSAARGARGPGAGIAAMAGARNAVDVAGAGVGQAQQAALSDQANAQAQLSQILGTGRQQDIGLATTNAELAQNMNLANLSAQNQAIFQQAGLDQAQSLANMQARLQTMGMNDQAALAYLSQLFGMDQAEMMARIQQEAAQMGQSGVFGDLLAAGGQILGRPSGAGG